VTVTITQDFRDIAGVDDNSVVWFSQPLYPRAADNGSTIITTRRVSATPVSGVLAVELEPGSARVQFDGCIYDITVPDTDATLWPLIEAGLPIPPAQEASAVRNAGGVALIRVLTEAEYAALSSVDPETLYVVVPNP